jgi:hypothetical protein
VSAAAAAPPGLRASLLGRTFLHPALDYLLIGGGLSLLVTAVLALRVDALQGLDGTRLALLILGSNAAHFASSTVRLYTKPGADETWPILTRVLPLVFLVLLTLALALPEGLGERVQKLYLTWSPFHYAAQTYGLCVMYSYRSGCALGSVDKRWLRWACLLPFIYYFCTAPQVGLDWVLAGLGFDSPAWLVPLRETGGPVLMGLALLAPLVAYAALRTGRGRPMPLIGPLLMLSNGIWWLVLLPLDAFVWATIFHGIQYLVIVVVFHVRDELARPGNRRGGLHHALRFYAMSLLLGFALFHVLPQGYVLAGFGMVESVLLVVAAINIHHFVVDAFIWRLRPGTDNRRIVEAGD